VKSTQELQTSIRDYFYSAPLNWHEILQTYACRQSRQHSTVLTTSQ